MLLAQADRRLGIADRVIPDGRDQERIIHLLPDILRARIVAIVGREEPRAACFKLVGRPRLL